MANNGGIRSSTLGRNESLIIGILVGMVLGLAVAGAVAWYIVKRPSPYLHSEPTNSSKPAAELAQPAQPVTQASAPAATSQAGSDTKPRFEFYKILTGKQDSTGSGSTSQQAAKPPAGGKTAAQGSSYFLQAASFTNAGDADKLKAKLALLGLEVNVQTANIPGTGVRYRVRLGPYGSTDELNKANAVLKQNGIMDAAPMRAQ
jgi:cell division protein FtsN